MFIERGRERERDRERQRERQTETERDKERQRETHRDRFVSSLLLDRRYTESPVSKTDVAVFYASSLLP